MRCRDRQRSISPSPFRTLRDETRGSSVVEYIAIVGLVALAVVTGYRVLGSQAGGAMDRAADHVAMLVGQTNGAGSCPGGVCTGPNSCFVAGTEVATPTGLRAIESLRVGELVLARDESSFAVVARPITERFVTPDAPLVEVALRPAAAGFVSVDVSTERIRATPGHPFFTRDRGWVEAQWLTAGEPVVDVGGGDLEVASVARIAAHATVYNVEVATSHTYFVGRAGAWVHNPNTPCGGTGYPPGYVPVNDTNGTTNCYYCTTAALSGTTVATLQNATGIAPINGGAPVDHINGLMQHVGVGEGTYQSATDINGATQQLMQAAQNAPDGKTFGVAYQRPDGTGHMVAGVVNQGKPYFVDFQQHPPLVSESIQGVSQIHVFPTNANGTAINNPAFVSAQQHGQVVPHLN